MWNPGERVEGYTNFGWTFVMGLVHLLGLSPSHTCLLVQILGIPILWLCLFATVRLARACELPPMAAGCAVVMVGGYYNLLYFTMFGMETGLLTVFVALGLAASVRCIRQSEGSLAPMLWFAPAMLVRPDAIVFLLVCFFYLLVVVGRGRWKILAGFGVVTAVVIAHLLWRHSFYGEWLPNTYYLKATGWPLSQRFIPGLGQTVKTVFGMGIPCVLAIGVLLPKPTKDHVLLLVCFFAGAFYQFYVGGDAWPRDRMVIPGVIGLLLHGMTPEIPVFERNYRPVAIQVDGIDIPLSVRKDTRLVHGGRPLSWKQGIAMLKHFLFEVSAVRE